MAFREREPARRPPLRPVPSRPVDIDIERTRQPERRPILQTAARVFGWINVVIGVLAFLTPLTPGVGTGLFTAGPGLLLGVFAMNWLHGLAHIILGAIGIASAKRMDTARNYFIGMVIVFGLLTIIGLAMARPGIYYMLGMANNYADNWLHGILALAALVLAFTDRERRPTTA